VAVIVSGSRHSDKVTGSTGTSLGSVPCMARDFAVLLKRLYRLWGPLPFKGYWVLFPAGVKRPRREVDHSHIIRMLRMSGAVPTWHG
jgi:hypothetical protein